MSSVWSFRTEALVDLANPMQMVIIVLRARLANSNDILLRIKYFSRCAYLA